MLFECDARLIGTDDPDNNEVSAFFPRIVFPVELLADLVFPRSTILISSPTNFAEIITLRTSKTTIVNDVVKQLSNCTLLLKMLVKKCLSLVKHLI